MQLVQTLSSKPNFGSPPLYFKFGPSRIDRNPPLVSFRGAVWSKMPAPCAPAHSSRISEFKIASRRVGPTTCRIVHSAPECDAKTVERPISLSPTPCQDPWPSQGNFLVLLIESLLWFQHVSPCSEFNSYFSSR